MTSNNGKLRTNATWKWVPLREVRIDLRVQRELRPGWVAKRAQEFNPDDIGAIVLSLRADGHYYALDGQHRVELLRSVGWGDQQVWAEVYEGLTLEQEAAIFLGRNEKITVATLDKFRVRVTANNEEAVTINRIVQGLGLRIGSGPSRRTVGAVAALERVYRGAGIGESGQSAVLRDTLVVLREAWGEDRTSFEGPLIEGVGKMLVRYNTHVDRPQLIRKLAGWPGGAPGVAGQARGRRNIIGGKLADAHATVIVELYNKGKRGRGMLDPWRQ